MLVWKCGPNTQTLNPGAGFGDKFRQCEGCRAGTRKGVIPLPAPAGRYTPLLGYGVSPGTYPKIRVCWTAHRHREKVDKTRCRVPLNRLSHHGRRKEPSRIVCQLPPVAISTHAAGCGNAGATRIVSRTRMLSLVNAACGLTSRCNPLRASSIALPQLLLYGYEATRPPSPCALQAIAVVNQRGFTDTV